MVVVQQCFASSKFYLILVLVILGRPDNCHYYHLAVVRLTCFISSSWHAIVTRAVSYTIWLLEVTHQVWLASYTVVICIDGNPMTKIDQLCNLNLTTGRILWRLLYWSFVNRLSKVVLSLIAVIDSTYVALFALMWSHNFVLSKENTDGLLCWSLVPV